MERTYELQEWYPSCFDLLEEGDTVTFKEGQQIIHLGCKSGHRIGMHIDEVRDSKFWKKLKQEEKEFEVKAIRYLGDLERVSKILRDPENINAWIKGHAKDKWEIYEVKRLSDGQVFTIGDMITGFTYNIPRLIIGFKITDSGNLKIKQESLINWFKGKTALKDAKLTKGFEVLEAEDKGLAHSNITKVKRFSDKEVFSVGDKTNKGVIQSFKVTQPSLQVCCVKENGYGDFTGDIKHLEHKKDPLFITEDGVEIYEGDIYYVPQKPYMERDPSEFKARSDKNYKNDDSKRFSSRILAQRWTKQYRKKNKKQYSYADIEKALENSKVIGDHFYKPKFKLELGME